MADDRENPTAAKVPTANAGPSQALSLAPQLDEVDQHPIARAIRVFLHRARDIELCARIYIPLASKRRKQRLDELRKQLGNAAELSRNADGQSQVIAIRELLRSLSGFERLRNTEMSDVLERSLFLSLFSSYDAFTGALLTALYDKRRELYESITRQMPFGEVLKFKSLDELRAVVLQEEIEGFRRKSYVEQFNDLESKFDLKLTAFKNWPSFVESGQRRNLITHTDGIVSEQYIEVCKKHGVSQSLDVKAGTRLGLGTKYFMGSCELMMEVAVKLAQTLWRKVLPHELESADKNLHRTVFDFLELERWAMAERLGDYAVALPRVSKDIDRRISLINYAIALRFGGNPAAAATALTKMDWSASLPAFKLAVEVLNGRFEEAGHLMATIGKSGDLISETAYHVWPLFREFRETKEFGRAYEMVFGYPFLEELQRTAGAAKIAAAEASTLQSREIQQLEAETSGTVTADQTASTSADPQSATTSSAEPKPSKTRSVKSRRSLPPRSAPSTRPRHGRGGSRKK